MSPKQHGTVRNYSQSSSLRVATQSTSESEVKDLTILELICLTIGLGGLQFTWAVELSYGTPYLLSLGMPKSAMSLVWLAGPLSGLLVQPIVGCISDNSTSKYGRRKPVLALGFLFSLVSMVIIGYTHEIALMFSESSSESFPKLLMVLATLGFYGLDFSINAVQAGLRALIVDVSPLSQQEVSNAYASKMIGLGNVIGYFVGFLDLPNVFYWLGDSQMKILCIIASSVFGLTLLVTSLTVKEKVFETHSMSDRPFSYTEFVFNIFKRIFKAFLNLPRPLQSICNVQFFAWIGWFPFLFYSTTWFAEILGRTFDITDPEFLDHATQAGSFALFLYSIVSLIASFVLPYVVKNETALAVQNETHDSGRNASITSIFVFSSFNLRALFSLSHFLFGGLMLSTALVRNTTQASVIVAFCGVCWAIMMWAPFSLLGEFTRILFDPSSRSQSIANTCVNPEEQPLNGSPGDALDAGLVLGVHNAYVVLPQFLVSFFGSILFYYIQLESDAKPKGKHHSPAPKSLPKWETADYTLAADMYIPKDIYVHSMVPVDNDSLNVLHGFNGTSSPGSPQHSIIQHPEPIGVLLRIGGVSSIIAGFMAFKIPSPNSLH